ncbi:hypothetical protein H1P_2260007 [Hyella patelloides LEGE 07179]|uniref:Uncharacterized protein n=1 Tax=Hyella patelloides LEGE 07179 TaxID=945734 RepID=A0A563VR15_9CYAN|nr:hypothetical protein H1P_2260007 [Hyella patelloides LEGE 07179]
MQFIINNTEKEALFCKIERLVYLFLIYYYYSLFGFKIRKQ